MIWDMVGVNFEYDFWTFLVTIMKRTFHGQHFRFENGTSGGPQRNKSTLRLFKLVPSHVGGQISFKPNCLLLISYILLQPPWLSLAQIRELEVLKTMIVHYILA